MKNHAQGGVVQDFGLVATDEAVSQRRADSNISSRTSDDQLRAEIIKGYRTDLQIDCELSIFKERVESLIGTADRKDSFFIYGGGTVSHAFRMKHKPVYLLTRLM